MSDFVTPWTVAHQAPLSMGFPRQEYWKWRWLTFPSPKNLPDPRIESASLVLAGGFFTAEPAGKPSTAQHIDVKANAVFLLLMFSLL